MNKYLLPLALGSLWAMPSYAQTSSNRPKTISKQPVNQQLPNILLFLVDDMGWQDTSVPFGSQVTPLNRFFRTPNMERLAAQGEVFTNAYANQVCTPTRVSLMTGLSAARHHVTNWTGQKDRGTDGENEKLSPPAWNVNGLSNSPATPRAVFAPTLPQKLREAGYQTIIVGKGHFGTMGTPGGTPKNLGFDVSIASSSVGSPGSYLGTENYAKGGESKIPDLEKYRGTNTFITEALTQEANRSVNEAVAAHKPFFLYLSQYAVHQPIQKDDRFYSRYKAEHPDVPDVESRYATLVEGMDKSLGDVMDNLEKQGIAENTVIVFVSDNGGLSVGSRAKPYDRQNLPLRSGKGSVYEGGIRVPMIVKWPKITNSATRCDVPVSIEDLFPTLLSITNQPIPATDGINILPWLHNAKTEAPKRQFLWHFPNAWREGGSDFAFYSALRDGDWKLIFRYGPRTFELYNLHEDLGERNDLAATQPEKVKELAATMKRLLTERNAQMPLDKTTGQPVALPEL